MSEPIVLIVDDEEMMRTALEQWLRLSGFATVTAADANEAMASIDDCHPHVVLTDVRMPGLSGLDLLRSIAERGLPTEVILITGHGDVPMAVEAMRAGAFGWSSMKTLLNRPDDGRHGIAARAPARGSFGGRRYLPVLLPIGRTSSRLV